MTADNAGSDILVTVKASPVGIHCPFGASVAFELRPGGCVYLKGPSGRGKTTLANLVAGLASQKTLARLHIKVQVTWNDNIPVRERCGVLFQQTTLLDDLTVAGNVCVALKQHERCADDAHLQMRIKQVIKAVGLDYALDAGKRPTQLSGGMGRRACLALQLAQAKHVIILDEPFTGLDHATAVSVAKELPVVHLLQQGMALVLISHEPDLVEMVLDATKSSNNRVITLPEPAAIIESQNLHHLKPSLFGTSFWDRFKLKLHDYIVWSLPLVVLTFCACGLALSMLSADLLNRLDVSGSVLEVVDTDVRPLIKMLTGEEASPLTLMGLRIKVRGMLDRTVQQAKSKLFAIGMAKLFVLEIGPLLTALLLCGRIGGSYAGKVARRKPPKYCTLTSPVRVALPFLQSFCTCTTMP